MTSPFHATRRGHVLEVVLDRPKANAIDGATSRELGQLFASFRDDDSLRAAIVTAAGDRFFSAGWDLKSAAEGESANIDWGIGGFGGLPELPNLGKPVVAAVNGMACGGVVELVLGCDIVIASENAKFALPEINVGTLAETAMAMLPRRLPYNIAVELLMTGRWMLADEAKHWGFVNEVVPAEDLMSRARAVADELADGPPLIFAAIKDALRRTQTTSDAEGISLTRALHTVQRAFASEDAIEGPRAFAERRKPVWKGR